MEKNGSSCGIWRSLNLDDIEERFQKLITKKAQVDLEIKIEAQSPQGISKNTLPKNIRGTQPNRSKHPRRTRRIAAERRILYQKYVDNMNA